MTATAQTARSSDPSHAVATTREAKIRPARREDSGAIAELFLIASDGLAAYIWSQLAEAGETPLETGRRRYAREDAAFSYRNCLVAEEDSRVVAMLHSFPMPPRDTGPEASANDNAAPTVDPVLRPYAELEDPGSLYVSGLAVFSEHRGRGLGRRLMEEARRRAEALGQPRLSLICFEANQGALQLYRRLGFVAVDRRPLVPHPTLHYTEGDALLLVRGLD